MRRALPVLIALGVGLVWALLPGHGLRAQAPVAHSPVAVAWQADGNLLVAEADGQRVVKLSPEGKELAAAKLPAAASGMAVSRDGSTVVVTLGNSSVQLLDAATLKLGKRLNYGYGPTAPVFNADGTTIYVASTWTNEVAALDAATGKPRWQARVLRRPMACALTPDGRKLFVANLLTADAATADTVACEVTVLNTADGAPLASVRLPDGSQSVHDIVCSPDGSTVYAVHILSRYHLPTTQLERGWMNTNAITLIDAATNERINTVLLDEVDRGAANPWAVAVTPDSKTVVVATAGTHELSVIDAVALRAKLDATAKAFAARTPTDNTYGNSGTDGVSEDLTYLLGLRRRIALPLNGPRCVAVTGERAVAAGYFSDTVATVDLASGATTSFPLLPEPSPSLARRGEQYFSDGSFCFQEWQSCLSCHPETRADGLNWDLLNDGIGNPKNTKSMFLTFQTPPAMSLGVREDVGAAVRAGVRVIQMAVRPEEDLLAIDDYLRNLKGQPSPLLVNGKLSAAAKRGQRLFESDEVGCASCHSGEYYTTKQHYKVGTGTGREVDSPFDTPSLREVWRTGPYLHDGRAATLEELFTKFNPGDHHGKTSQLKPDQISDLCAYVGSL